TVTANNTTMRYGSKIPVLTASYSPANPAGLTTPTTCTTTATSTSPVGTYPITCAGAVDASYTITYVTGTVTVTPVPLTVWASNVSMLSGSTPPVISPLYVGFVAGDTSNYHGYSAQCCADLQRPTAERPPQHDHAGWSQYELLLGRLRPQLHIHLCQWNRNCHHGGIDDYSS